MKLERVLVLAANPKAEGYLDKFKGYDSRSGDVQVHIDFLQRRRQSPLVYWDIPGSSGPIAELFHFKIQRGYIYCTADSPEGVRMGRGIHYAVDIQTISRRLVDYPDVDGLPEWRGMYTEESVKQLCWIGITAIRDIPRKDFACFRSAKTGLPFGRDFVISWDLLLEDTSCGN